MPIMSGVNSEPIMSSINSEPIMKSTEERECSLPSPPVQKQQESWCGREVLLQRHPLHGFGFTLRHFVAYPPPPNEQSDGEEGSADLQLLDTVFILAVKVGSPAHQAGLKKGERLVSVQGVPVGGSSLSFQGVVRLVQSCSSLLSLLLIPPSQDFLQQVFGDTAHHPASNLGKKSLIRGDPQQQQVWPPDSKALPVEPSVHPHSYHPTHPRPPSSSQPAAVVARVTDQPFTHNWSQRQNSRGFTTDSDSQITESIYAADSISSPDSSGWTSESSLFCVGPGWTYNNQMPKTNVPQPKHGTSNDGSRNPPSSALHHATVSLQQQPPLQHIYAQVQHRPQQPSLSIMHPAGPLKLSTDDPRSVPPALPPPRHSEMPQQSSSSQQYPSTSHQITVPPSLLNQPPFDKDQQHRLVVLPISETRSSTYYGFGGSDRSSSTLTAGDSSLPPSDLSGSTLTATDGGVHSLPQPLCAPIQYNNNNNNQATDNNTPKHSTTSNYSQQQQQKRTTGGNSSSFTSSIPSLIPTILGAAAGGGAGGSSSYRSTASQPGSSTIYTSPGHPIIYPSQQSGSPYDSGTSSQHHKSHSYGPTTALKQQQQHNISKLYDSARKSSLPVIKPTSPNRSLSSIEKLQGNYSKPVQIMDRKQAVYTIRNSLPPASRSPTLARKMQGSAEEAGTASEINNEQSSSRSSPSRGSVKDKRSTQRHGVYEPFKNEYSSFDVDSHSKQLAAHIYESLEPKTTTENYSYGGSSDNNKDISSSSSNNNSSSSFNFSQNFSEAKPSSMSTSSDVPFKTVDSSSIELTNSSQYNVDNNNLNTDKKTLSDKSSQAVLDRIKRNVQKKEEFLKQPAEPLWPATSVHRDYHVSPQKLSQPLWPPPCTQVPPSPGVISKALTFVANSKMAAARRKKAKSELEAKTTAANTQASSTNSIQDDHGGFVTSSASSSIVSSTSSNEHLSAARPLVVNTVPKPYGNEAANKYGGKYVTQLPRIQENLPSKELGSLSSLGSLRSDSVTPSNSLTPAGSQVSLSSPTTRSTSLAWVGDNDRIKQLQIVSKRAKKFESAQVGKPSQKSTFQRFELPRLSQKSKFAQRKQEFEKMEAQTAPVAGSLPIMELGTYYNRRARKSLDLSDWDGSSRPSSPLPPSGEAGGGVVRSQSDGGALFSVNRALLSHLTAAADGSASTAPDVSGDSGGFTGNRTVPVGGPQVHCQPPAPATPVVCERVRANSLCEGITIPSSSSRVAARVSTPAVERRRFGGAAAVSRHHSFLSVLRPRWHNKDQSSSQVDDSTTHHSAAPQQSTDNSHHHSTSTPPGGTPPLLLNTTTASASTTTTTCMSHHLPSPPPNSLPVAALSSSPTITTHHHHHHNSSSSRPSRPTYLPISVQSSSHHHPHHHYHHHNGDDGTAHQPSSPSSQTTTGSHHYHHNSSNSYCQSSPAHRTPSNKGGATPSSDGGAVLLRRRHRSRPRGDEGERVVRRVSYLKATSSDRATTEDPSPTTDYNSSLADQHNREQLTPGGGYGPLTPATTPSDSPLTLRLLHYKLVLFDGKRAVDRSWKTGCGAVRGHSLLLYRERSLPLQSPVDAAAAASSGGIGIGVWSSSSIGGGPAPPAAELEVCVRGASVAVASDYNKRRHVLRLTTPAGTELLLQADSHAAMNAWVNTLNSTSSSSIHKDECPGSLDDDSCDISTSSGGGKSQRNKHSSSIPVPPYSTSTGRTHSPTTHSSPFTPKNRKSAPNSFSESSSGGEKSRTWKGIIGKRLKKMHSSTPAATYPPGASFGVPLHLCPMSEKDRFVPLVVVACVEAIETLGMNIQGIYRIPGNKAAVTYLTDMVNRGPQAIDLTDPRWSDVNVISSLLKQYFQKLPEPLIPSDLYPLFMQACQVPDLKERLMSLRELVHALPEYHYDTLQLLCLHLQKVVKSSDANKMDVHNLAIVFGPTLIRAVHDNMARMVKDMPHQCRIVEALISQASWFFSDGDPGEPPPLDPTVASGLSTDMSPLTETDPLHTQALLDNVSKLQGTTANGSYNKSDNSKKVLVSSIISAASRKVNKSRHHRRSADDFECEWSSRDAERSRDGGEVSLNASSDQQSNSSTAGGVEDRLSRSLEGTISASDHISRNNNHNTSAPSNYNNNNGSTVKLRRDNSNSAMRNSPARLLSERETLDELEQQSVAQQQHRSEVLSSFGYNSTPPLDSNNKRRSQQLHRTSDTPPMHWKANTQERIRRFEEETKAMLERDLNKQHRSTPPSSSSSNTKFNITKHNLDEALDRAKEELKYDYLDYIADYPSVVAQIPLNDGSYSFMPTAPPPSTSPHLYNSLPSNTYPSSPPSTSPPPPHHHSPSSGVASPSITNTLFTNTDEQQTEALHHTQAPHSTGHPPLADDGGSDMLSAITATFEKMRSEGTTDLCVLEGDEAGGRMGAAAYRDPSLHRAAQQPGTNARRTHHHKTGSIDSSSIPVKRTDSFGRSSSVKEKRSREFNRRSEMSVEEKKPKEMKSSSPICPDYLLPLRHRTDGLKAIDSEGQKMRRLSTDVRHRTHNVKELKEKFEQQQHNNNNSNSPGLKENGGGKTGGGGGNRKSGGRRSRSNIKRRHTVGGTKDASKVVALHKLLIQWQQQQASCGGGQQQLQQQLPLLLQQKNTNDAFEQLMKLRQPWDTKERLGTSSPDLPTLISMLLSGSNGGGDQQQNRRLSVIEPWSLQPVLESHV